MRNRAWRRTIENIKFLKRKRIVNGAHDYKYTDEQVKVYQDTAVNWMSNEWWSDSYKKKCNRKRRREMKYNIIKGKYE